MRMVETDDGFFMPALLVVKLVGVGSQSVAEGVQEERVLLLLLGLLRAVVRLAVLV